MHKDLFLLALLAAVGVAPAQAQSRLLWGEPEVIGLNKIRREEVVSRLPIKLGKPMQQKESEILAWCEVLYKLPIQAMKCSGAVEGSVVHLVVEIVEKDAAPIKVQPSRAPAASARIAPETKELLVRREYRVQEMAAEGMTPTERLTPSGVLVADDPELRMFDAQLREHAAGQRESYIKIVLDPRHAERKLALLMLAWAGRPEESVGAIHGRLLDPDPEIRNYTGRFILSVLARIEDSALAREVAQSFIAQLAIPTHVDRTKAVQGLAELLGHHPELRELIAREARSPLQALARDSVLQAVGGQAKGLLATLE